MASDNSAQKRRSPETDLASRKWRLYHLAAHRLGGALHYFSTNTFQSPSWLGRIRVPAADGYRARRNDLRKSFV